MNTQKNTEKLTDKAFSRLWITSIVGILICIACLCSTTWAWFSADQSAEKNTLQSGNFNLDISIAESQNATGIETKAQASEIKITELSNGKMSCTLAKGTYTVDLKTTSDTTVTKGFCKLTVGEKEYNTDSINADSTDSFTFTLDVAQDDTTVIFSPSWGLPAEVHVKASETLSIGAASSATE